MSDSIKNKPHKGVHKPIHSWVIVPEQAKRGWWRAVKKAIASNKLIKLHVFVLVDHIAFEIIPKIDNKRYIKWKCSSCWGANCWRQSDSVECTGQNDCFTVVWDR